MSSVGLDSTYEMEVWWTLVDWLPSARKYWCPSYVTHYKMEVLWILVDWLPSARKYWCPSHVTHYEMEVLRAVYNGQRQPQRSPPIGGSIEPLRGGAAPFSAWRTAASGSLRGRHR